MLAQRVDTSSDVMEKCAADAVLMRFENVESSRIGTRIGPFKLVREIATDFIIRRFEHERRILAKLEHSKICAFTEDF